MSSEEPVVTNVYCQGQDDAIFEFDDGHKVIFTAYRHGWGYQVEGLMHFWLYNGDTQVVRFDSRLFRSGPADKEHRFITVAEGYTPERIKKYWLAACVYANEEYFEKPYANGTESPEEMWFPWVVSGKSRMDLIGIEEGRIPLPESV